MLIPPSSDPPRHFLLSFFTPLRGHHSHSGASVRIRTPETRPFQEFRDRNYLERPPEFLACRESPINRNYLSPTESTPYRQTPKSMVRFPRSSCQDGIESGRCADTWHGLQPGTSTQNRSL